jgi:hypothetical protein
MTYTIYREGWLFFFSKSRAPNFIAIFYIPGVFQCFDWFIAQSAKSSAGGNVMENVLCHHSLYSTKVLTTVMGILVVLMFFPRHGPRGGTRPNVLNLIPVWLGYVKNTSPKKHCCSVSQNFSRSVQKHRASLYNLVFFL